MTATSEPSPSPSALPVQSDGQWHVACVWEVPPAVVLNASWTVISASAYDWAVAHQGLMIETDAGLYNCRNRVYSPLLGVWMQRDPEGYIDGMNLYEYVGGDPLSAADPLGLWEDPMLDPPSPPAPQPLARIIHT